MQEGSMHAGVIAAAAPLLDALAASRPVPAGGAAAAIALAFAASLGAKAARISGLDELVAPFLEHQGQAMAAAVEDCDAFDAVLAARRARSDGRVLDLAWRRATESPLSVVGISGRVVEALDGLRSRVRPSLTCDVAAARNLALAAASTSIANARENLRRVPPEQGRGELTERLEALELVRADVGGSPPERP